MNEINIYIGGQIRKYRKANGMTLQQLAADQLSADPSAVPAAHGGDAAAEPVFSG